MTQRTIEPYRDRTLPERFLRWIETIRARFKTIPNYTESNGSPEGVIFGQKADRYYDLTADEVYIKTTQGGNTGWVLITTGGQDATFQGFGQWRFRTAVDAFPAAGRLQFDDLVISNATEFYLNVTNDNGVDMSNFLALIQANDLVYVQISNDSTQYVVMQVDTPVLNGSVYTFPILLAEGVGSAPTNNTPVSVVVASTSSGGGSGFVSLTEDIATFNGDLLTVDVAAGNSPLVAMQFDNLVPGMAVFDLGGVGSGSTNHTIYRSRDQTGATFWELIDDHSLSSSNHRLYWRRDDGQRYLEFDRSGEIRIGGSESTELVFIDITNDQVCVRNDATFYLEQTAANANITGHGQLRVEASDDSLHYITEAGVDFDLTASGGGVAPGTVDDAALKWDTGTVAWIEATDVKFEGNGRVDFLSASSAILRLNTSGAALDEKVTDMRMANFSGWVIQSVSDGGFNGPALMAANRTGTAWQNLVIQTDVEILGSLYFFNSTGVQADLSNRGQLWIDVADDLLHYQDEFGVPQVLDPSLSELNIQNGNYTLLITDKGKTIAKQSGGAGETHTIPANASVAYKIGTWVAWDNDGGGDLTIAITTDTLVGTDGVTGSRTLGDNERALIQKIAATRWRYSASDL
jgi:hypothetical protein